MDGDLTDRKTLVCFGLKIDGVVKMKARGLGVSTVIAVGHVSGKPLAE